MEDDRQLLNTAVLPQVTLAVERRVEETIALLLLCVFAGYAFPSRDVKYSCLQIRSARPGRWSPLC